MELTLNVALEVASHEAVIRQTYRDSEGYDTWSVGLTSATGHDVTRYINNPQPLRKCLEIYVWALDNYADEVREAFRGHKLSEAQFAAALSFHWNTGAIKRATWVQRFKAGDMRGAREAIMWYRTPQSIIERRKKERNLFFDGEWTNNGTMTEFTRLTPRRTPVWSSATRIEVGELLAEIMGERRGQIDAPVTVPAPVNSLWGWLLKLLKGRSQ